MTADAFSALILQNQIADKIYSKLSKLDSKDTGELAKVGHEIRTLVRSTGIPEEVANEIREAYTQLCLRTGVEEFDVAVRSSA